MTVTVDITTFYKLNVTDTCAVWNILSTGVLYTSAIKAGCHFCITGYVEYEIYKPWKKKQNVELILKNRLLSARAEGQWKTYSLTLDDLLEVSAIEARQALSKGELSSIAYAKRTNLAFLTDDKKARKLAEQVLPQAARAQTTPHLLGWLSYSEQILDQEVIDGMNEHQKLQQDLRSQFVNIVNLAHQCRNSSKQSK